MSNDREQEILQMIATHGREAVAEALVEVMPPGFLLAELDVLQVRFLKMQKQRDELLEGLEKTVRWVESHHRVTGNSYSRKVAEETRTLIAKIQGKV